MQDISLGTALKAALLAGLAAGLVAAAFHFLVSEPLIERAIALEEQLRGAGDSGAAPISRGGQRVGLFAGFLLYGLTWGLLFGAVYHLARRRLPGAGPVGRGLTLALLGYWSVALFPFLKYPANPPGVGDPATLGYRQGLYFGVLVLSVVATGLAVTLARAVRRRAGATAACWWLALAVLAAFDATIYLAMPSNPDPVPMPAELVAAFRASSLAGLTLFWAVMGLVVGLLLREHGLGRAPDRAAVART